MTHDLLMNITFIQICKLRKGVFTLDKHLSFIKDMGNKDFNVEEFLESRDAQRLKQIDFFMGNQEDGKIILDYWESFEKGLIKKVFGDPEKQETRWALYIPKAAVEQKSSRKFPLIFCLHGAHNPIALTQSYGVIQVAAREEAFVITPENERLDNLTELFTIVKNQYPIDSGRVYGIGYSFGAFMTSQNALSNPSMFAGIGMGGMIFAGKVGEHEMGGVQYPSFEATEEMVANAAEKKMPMLLFLGEHEMLNLVPIWKTQDYFREDGVIDLSAEAKSAAFNTFRKVAGCTPAKFTNVEGASCDLGNPVTKVSGVEFERSEVRVYNGRKYYIGDSVNGSNECLFRTVVCEKMMHWTTEKFAELVWEHIGKYARDAKTGQMILL